MKPILNKSSFCFTVLIVTGMTTLLCAGFPTTTEAQVIAQPEELIFQSLTESLLVTLHTNGRQMSAVEVKNWSFYAGESVYNHMLRILRTDEGILVSPTATMEAGSYSLILNTAAGAARVSVKTPLTAHGSFIEEQVEAQGISEAEVKQQIGLSQVIERQPLQLNLASEYHVGDQLSLEMPQVASRRCVWKLNDEVLLEGPGANKFKYILEKTGPLEIVYEEWENDRKAAEAKASVTVKPQREIQVETKKNSTVQFRGPEGYGEYSWYVNDDLCCHTKDKQHFFDRAGTCRITCIAAQPLQEGLPALSEAAYVITIE